MSVYTCEAGRQIYRDGKPFISVHREGDTHPTHADTAVRLFAHFLNVMNTAPFNALVDTILEFHSNNFGKRGERL